MSRADKTASVERKHAGLRKRRVSLRRLSRRGVASVLAMMFLILFGSLVAAMAITSTGNIRTANMHLHVMRAMSAAETGLAVAEHRLNEASSRFVVAESDIDGPMSFALWTGDDGAIGVHEVMPPPSGFSEDALPAGIAEALLNAHASDQNLYTGSGFIDEPSIGSAPAGLPDSVYEDESWVFTPAVMIEEWPEGRQNPPPAYQIRYAPLAGGEYIRVIVEGVVHDFQRNSQPIRRTIMRDYRMSKSVRQALIAHSKILIGKNVSIEGDLGARFDEVDFANGDPIVMRSDFIGLDPILDLKIQDFWVSLSTNDVDGDNRLRVGHPIEGASGLDNTADYDGDGSGDSAFTDATGDGFLDEFDIFVRHFDDNNDGRVTMSAGLIEGTPAGEALATPEFVDASGDPIDDDLAILIDARVPDRNKNGIAGWLDTDPDQKYDPVNELPADYDAFLEVYGDVELGWRDGYLDRLDQYAKVSGGLRFRVSASDWENGQGPIGERLRGPIDPDDEDAPLTFNASDDLLPDINSSSFADTENALIAAADGDDFWVQVADQLGTTVDDLETWELEDNSSDDSDPAFTPVWSDDNLDGLPDNSGWAYWEKSPFNSPAFSDVYWRPVFKNFVFRNVEIPMGLNGLFENCTFVGVTYVRAYGDNTHPMWTELGSNVLSSSGTPEPKYQRYVYGDDAGETGDNAPDSLPDSAIPPTSLILMTIPGETPLDTGDVPLDEIASYGASYDLLPDPIIIDGARITDTKEISNNVRFHDSLFVGSIVADTPSNYTQVRNKVQFTGATRFTTVHPTEPDNGFLNPDESDLEDILSSSMMLPNYSVDIGTFNSPAEQDVRLQGAVIAGVLDARGNTEITGTLLLTFNPEYGEGPLQDVFGNPVGNPAGFNASLGYFGSADGDFESIDPETLPIVDGVRIVGWDTDGDGLVDVPHDETPPAGAVAIPFNGFGKIRLRHDPNMRLPDGLMLPLSMPSVTGTYQEGSL
ncbi:MAG: hypothetical protein AB8F26_03290 [Phycisphaerales bacterium]